METTLMIYSTPSPTSEIHMKYRPLLDLFRPHIFVELPGGILVGRVRIDPSMARHIAAHHHPTKPDGASAQRRKIQQNIDKMVNDLRSGRFPFTGETMQFDTNCMQINGQHRTEAIIRSETPMEVLVVIGVENNTFQHIDQGSRRNMGTCLSIAGHNNTRVMAASVLALNTFKVCGHFDSTCKTGSLRSALARKAIGGNQDALVAIEENPVLVDIVKKICTKSQIRRTIRFQGPCSALFYILYRVEPELALDYIEVLSLPEEGLLGLDTSYTPILQLRGRLNNDPRMSLPEMSALMIKVWNQLRSGHVGKMLRWNSNEGYPHINGVSYRVDGVPLLDELPKAVPLQNKVLANSLA